MKSLSGHHWITWNFYYPLVYNFRIYFSRTGIDKKIDADKVSFLVIIGTILGGLIIAGFFFRHFFE